LLSSKKIFWLSIIISSLLLYSCNSKKNDSDNTNTIDYENPEIVLQQAKNILGNQVKFAYKGKFDKDSVIEIAAGTEIQNKTEWGIKFFLLKNLNGALKQVFETPVLNGSFRQCLVQKIKFPSFDHELIYYNSQDYFLGSGGGEIYSYVVNFVEGKVYYAHLVAESGKPVSLFLSDNIDVPEIKAFFISNFKRDYPNVREVSKDIVLNF
jgi:hypothetical protein